MLEALNSGITGRAQSAGLVKINSWNPRDFAQNARRDIDDSPYGGGSGMLMQAGPLQGAIRAAKQVAPNDPLVIYLTPQGKAFNQAAAKRFAARDSLIFVAGRYEGIDERLMDLEPGEAWSLGDYVMSGGEIPAMAMMDSIIRLLPGALGSSASATLESMHDGLLEYPQYTRPETIGGIKVPEVLLKGDHKAIDRWRLKASLGKTWLQRPDLLEKKILTKTEQELLAEFKADKKENSN